LVIRVACLHLTSAHAIASVSADPEEAADSRSNAISKKIKQVQQISDFLLRAELPESAAAGRI
jgi:hypothetical protein